MILENVVVVDIVGVMGKIECKFMCVVVFKFFIECLFVVDRLGVFVKFFSGVV